MNKRQIAQAAELEAAKIERDCLYAAAMAYEPNTYERKLGLSFWKSASRRYMTLKVETREG